MNIKIPSLIFLFTMILTALLNGSARSTSTAPSDVIYFDLALDEPRQRLYGSDMNGGTIHVISMNTLEVLSTLSVGARPAGIDMSPDEKWLAVALNGQEEIAIIDLDTLSVQTRMTPQGTHSPNMPFEVLFGRPGRLYSVGNYEFDYIHVYNTDTWTEVGRSSTIVSADPRLAMTADQNTLYASSVSYSTQNILRFDISTDTPVQTASGPFGQVYVISMCVMADGRVFSSEGQAWSADLSTLIGNLPAAGIEIECSETKQRVYISTVTKIVAVDTTDLSRLYSVNMNNSVGVARLDEAEEYLYVSTSAGVRKLPGGLEPKLFLPYVARDYCADFFDDFSDPTSGWPVVDNNHLRTEYIEGEYLVHTKQRGYLYLVRAPTCDFYYYNLEVDARWLGDTGNSYGLIFEAKPDFSQYYMFDISSQYQMYRLLRRDPSGFTAIVGWLHSAAINTGSATNHLNAIRYVDAIFLYVNDTFLSPVPVLGIPQAGGVGIASIPLSDHRKSDARFDNFKLTGLREASAMMATSSMPVENGLEAPQLNHVIEPLPGETWR